MEQQPSSLDTTVPVATRKGWRRSSAKANKKKAAWVIRRNLEVRTDGGWTFYVPAPIALIGIASLLLVGLLSVLEPVRVRAAIIDRQATDLVRWEQAEARRQSAQLEAFERPLRDLRREALVRGIAPAGETAVAACEGLPADHLRAHVREATSLAAAIAAVASRNGVADGSLPSRIPIDLGGGQYFVTASEWLPDAVHVSSRKGERIDPFTGKAKQHKGLDISAPVGTSVIAPSSGTVTFAGSVDPNTDHYRSMLGNYVQVEHGKTGYSTIFAHLSKIDVKKGQMMKSGDKLGEVGTSGRSTAPHLHYQIMKEAKAVNPLAFIADVILVQDGKTVWYAKKDD